MVHFENWTESFGSFSRETHMPWPHPALLCSPDSSRCDPDPLDLNRILLDTICEVEDQTLLKISETA